MSSSLAAQLYTLREFTKTPQDIAQTLAKVKKIGYEAVQLSALGPIESQQLQDILASEGLQVAATHTSFPRLQNELDAVIAEHKLWGCDYVAIGAMPTEFRNAAGYHEFAQKITAIGRELAAAGIMLGYHNHSFEFEKFNGKTGLEIIACETDPEFVKIEIDTYWVQHGGADPAAWIRKLKGRLPAVHFKDMGVIDKQQVMAEVGEGNLNWPEIIKACQEVGTKWYIVEQDICRRDPFESLAISLRNLKAMGLK